MMYTHLTKPQALPLVISVSSKAKCFTQSLPLKYSLKPSLNLNCKTQREFSVLNPSESLSGFRCKSMEMGIIIRPRSVIGVHVSGIVKARACYSSYSRRDAIGGNAVRNGKPLPWLVSSRGKESKRVEKPMRRENNRSSWEKSVRRVDNKKGNDEGSYVSSWEVAAKRVVGKGSVVVDGSEEGRSGMIDKEESYDGGKREGVGEEEEVEEVDDPRWGTIKSKFGGVVDGKAGSEKPEIRRWSKQESWGRKTWKEATESTVPKMVGEGVYGVGPVLAALSAGRREFYALYVQEGLDLSNNNKKKKDKKGFEKIMRMAEKIGLSIKEASKHDLNMVVDNRPHQGLVLDASPLEMVKIKELDPVLAEEDKGSVWVALDEVTDPQNLGAIIRSSYFFGAAGIVLCAKNSAPLSGVVSKASAGSLELVELRYCKNMMQFLSSSAENGWRVLGGSVAPKAVPLNEVTPDEPTILVLGSEGTGLRPLVERSCTDLVRIPGNIPVDVAADDSESAGQTSGSSGEEFRTFMAVESLNVSVAAGVLLHHLTGNTYGKVDG